MLKVARLGGWGQVLQYDISVNTRVLQHTPLVLVYFCSSTFKLLLIGLKKNTAYVQRCPSHGKRLAF